MAKQSTAAKAEKGGEVVDIKTRAVRKTKDGPSKKAEVEAKKAEVEAKKSLKTLETKIDKLRDQAIRVEWDIGSHLNDIYKKDLWQVAGAKDFNAYVQERFGFTRQTAKSFMRIAEMFARDEVSDIPITSLRLIVTVPDPADREELVQQVREEKPTKKELAEVVKAKRAEAGLKTERAGFEGTVMVSQRLKPGIIAKGDWQTVRGKEVAQFELGGQVFQLEDHSSDGEAETTWVLKMKKPSAKK